MHTFLAGSNVFKKKTMVGKFVHRLAPSGLPVLEGGIQNGTVELQVQATPANNAHQ